MKHTFNTYVIVASMEHDGQIISLDQAEILGESFNHIYVNEYDAESDLDDLQSNTDELDVPGPVSYSIKTVTNTITIPDEINLCNDGGEDSDGHKLNYYINFDIKLNEKTAGIACCVGARDSDHGSIKAAGCSVKPYCSAWFIDSSDYQDVPQWARRALNEALYMESYSLYSAAEKEHVNG